MCNRTSVTSQDKPTTDASYQSWTRVCHAQYILMSSVEKIDRALYWSGIVAAASVASTAYFWPRLGKWKIFIPLLAPGTYKFLRDFTNEVHRISLARLNEAYRVVLGAHERGQQEFEAVFCQWCQGRRFALFENGYMGWVPAAARVGDVGVMWRGCRIPYVIRENRRREGWSVLGDAYVHGLMDGVELGEGVWEEDIRVV